MSVRYVSTRGGAPAAGFLDAVLAGLAPDGGLYFPESWPSDLDSAEFRRACAIHGFPFAVRFVLAAFAGDELTDDEIGRLVVEAYLSEGEAGERAFDSLAITPLRQHAPGDWLLELFHGPSLAFKDIAMRLIGPLYDLALTKRDERLSVICATSGDTGGAAVEALKGRERIDLFVLTPKGRVSDVQRRFMTSSGAANVHTLELDADFDACQAILKQMFADAEFASRARLSGVNSINWTRILAQSAYFHAAANALSAGGVVHFAVPTGNFGDAFAGYIAKKMGAPVGTLLIATNANDILSRALTNGRYERGAASHATLSPAMDIQVASNFERLVYDVTDAETTKALFASFAQSGGFDLPPAALEKIRAQFVSASVSDDETLEEMENFWDEGRGMIVCPHTAVALAAAGKAALTADAPLVTLATAHPAKFPETVEKATGVRPALPARVSDLFQREERVTAMAADVEAVKEFVRTRSRAWG
ncbi:MAG: threonine synthase [Hyphomonadaceae bacterium]